jgi:hypothetical protein
MLRPIPQEIVYKGTISDLRISAVDGTAFIDNCSAITTYADNAHRVEIYDSAGKRLVGIAKEAGSGESLEIADPIVSISKSNPGIINLGTGHAFSDGDLLKFSGLSEMTELNGEYSTLAETASDAWVQVAPTLESQTYILSLAVFNGKLYGGTSPGGRLFEWNGTDAWVQVAPTLESQTYIHSLAVFNGKLYGGTYPGGRLFEWNGTDAWVQVAPTLESQTYILSLAVFNGKLYGGTYPGGRLFEWNGTDAWVQVAPTLESQTYIRSLAVFNGKLYGGTSPGGRLFEWNGTDAWVQVAPTLESQTYIRSLAVFNGKLYGGTYSGGRLFEWNGTDAWVQVAPTLESQTYILSLAVFNGKLYGGTSPGGRLFEWNGWYEIKDTSSYTAEITGGNCAQKVTAPSTDGIIIVNAKGGSTENFTSVDAGFTYNAASYTVIVKKLR